VLIQAIEDMLYQLSPKGSHRLFEMGEKNYPIDAALLPKNFLKNLKLIFFKKDSIRIQSLS
jgi:hypothetical protein